MIKIKNLSFAYGNGQDALDGINLTIKEGEFVLLTGDSGSGKSTLVRCLNGLVPNFYGGSLTGSIKVDGKKVTSTKEMSRTVGMLFQDPESMFLSTTVEREIGLTAATLCSPASRRDVQAKTLGLAHARVEEIMEKLGISHLKNRSLFDLSGGEKQKVALASVLAPKPKVLVLDEPLSELDHESVEGLLNLLKKLNRGGMTIILIEQRTERVYNYVGREIVLEGGRVAYDGEPKKNWEEIEEPKTKPGEVIIRLDGITYAYGKNRVFDSFSGEFMEGELAVLEGKNGSGKTTLLKLIMGLLKPESGIINVGGVYNPTVEQTAGNVGYVFQNPNNHLFAETVKEEVEFILKNTNEGGDVSNILRQFGILRYKDSYPRYLSGGEKQRVALASIMVAEPKVLLLDEPTRGMDHSLKKELAGYLIEYVKQGNLVIMATHDDYMAQCATRRVRL